MPQIARNAGQRIGHQRFAAELLEHLEQQALDRLGGAQRLVQRSVAQAQAQRQAIGRAAK